MIERSFIMEKLSDKKTSIFDSALELINEHGFHGCPISQVAKNAGVAAGTIYTYFQSKDELILGLFEYASQQIKNFVSSKDDRKLNFEERFFNYWRNLSEFYFKNPSIHGFYDQFLNSPFNSEENQNKPNIWHEWCYSFFEMGVEEGAIKKINPVILSIMVNTNVNSIVKVRKSFGKKLAKNNLDLEEIPNLIWAGIKK